MLLPSCYLTLEYNKRNGGKAVWSNYSDSFSFFKSARHWSLNETSKTPTNVNPKELLRYFFYNSLKIKSSFINIVLLVSEGQMKVFFSSPYNHETLFLLSLFRLCTIDFLQMEKLPKCLSSDMPAFSRNSNLYSKSRLTSPWLTSFYFFLNKMISMGLFQRYL